MFDCKIYTETFRGWENMNRVDYTFYGKSVQLFKDGYRSDRFERSSGEHCVGSIGI